MGKRIASQARGKGSFTYRVRRRAYRYEIRYPPINAFGTAKVIRLLNSPGHSAPLLKFAMDGNTFFGPAHEGAFEGQEVHVGKRPDNKLPMDGDILRLKDIPQATRVFNIEFAPGNGGKLLRSAGSFAVIMNNDGKSVEILIKRRRIKINENSRATVGTIAGGGRLNKPLIKAGKMHHMMKAKGRKWHRTSAVKVNAVDHPFGGGRGKRIKSKIAKRNAPPGAKVGHIRPSRTGRTK